MFRKRAKKNIKSMDKIVTGVIIWSAVASIFGISKTKKWQEVIKKISEKKSSSAKAFIWKFLVGILRIFSKKNK